MIRQINSYILLDQIGRGEFGKVFRAVDPRQDHKEVAIKVIKSQVMSKTPELAKFIRSEREILPQLCHPNIVSLFETITTDDCLYFVYEYCPGGNLDQRLSQGRLQETTALDIFA